MLAFRALSGLLGKHKHVALHLTKSRRGDVDRTRYNLRRPPRGPPQRHERPRIIHRAERSQPCRHNIFYLRSILRTRNRDLRTLGYSSIIAKVPITKHHTGLERFNQSGFTFGLNDRSIHYIIIEILDDAVEPVTIHGGEWQVTLEFEVEEAPAYAGPTDYRALIGNGSLLGSANIAACQRADAPSGGPQRVAGADRESVLPPGR